MIPPCTTQGCDEPTQNYLCHTCTQELADAQETVPDLIPTLVLIARKQETPFTQRSARRTGGKAGPGEPVHLGAIALIQHFEDMQPAEHYALHPDGARRKEQTEAHIRNADIMVNGEKEDKPSEAYTAYKIKMAPVLSPAEIVAWCASEDGPGIQVTEKQLANWKYQGRLHPANQAGRPKYHGADVYLAWDNSDRAGWRPSPEHGSQNYVR